jgi:hypothetical protein
MPRYFVTVTMPNRIVEDDAGAAYASPTQACEAANRIAPDLSEDPDFAGCTIQVLKTQSATSDNAPPQSQKLIEVLLRKQGKAVDHSGPAI